MSTGQSRTHGLPFKAIALGMQMALKAFPFSWLDKADPSTPRVWQLVDAYTVAADGGHAGQYVLRLTRGDSCRPWHFWDLVIDGGDWEDSARAANRHIKPFTNKFSPN